MILREFESADHGRGSAQFSDDLVYRYTLSRFWDELVPLPPMVFVMLNPSTADERVLDPTVRRCVGFAKRERCGGVVVVNLFALRSTDPDELLRSHAPPIGETIAANDDAIKRMCVAAHLNRGIVVLGYGSHKAVRLYKRDEWMRNALREWQVPAYVLRTNADGIAVPGHPLYLRADSPLVRIV